MILPFCALQQLVEIVLHFEQVSRAVKFVECFHSCFKLGPLFFGKQKSVGHFHRKTVSSAMTSAMSMKCHLENPFAEV